MRSIRSLLAGIPSRAWAIAVVLALAGCFLSLQSYIEPIRSTKCVLDDVDRAIEAVRGGAIDYSGRCFATSIHGPDAEQQLQFQRAETQQILDSHLDELSDDPWHGSANGVWGSVMVGALLFGAIAAGSMMESGTAAWALSNGWSRRSWVRVFLLTTVVWVVVVYLIAVPAHWVGTRWWLGSFGISVPASMPGWAVIAPIPGLLFYAMLATTLGLLFKTEMFALVGSIIFVIVERVVANVFRPPTVLPGMLQDAAVRSTIRESTMEWWVAALILLGLAGAILAAIQWWFAHRMDVPDRPL